MKILWRREWWPTPVFLPGESHGQRSLAGYSPWGCKDSDTTKQLTLLLLQLGCHRDRTGLWSWYPRGHLCFLLAYLRVKLSVQFTQLCLTRCDPMNCSTLGLTVHHQLLELTQTQVYYISDAIHPSHPLSSPSSPTFNHSQHQGLFQWVSSSHQVAKVLEFQLQYQSFQWIFRTDFL